MQLKEERVILLLRINGWPILTDETVQKINAARPLVVPHEAVGLRNINSLFWRWLKRLTAFIGEHRPSPTPPKKLDYHSIAPNNIFVRTEVVKTPFFILNCFWRSHWACHKSILKDRPKRTKLFFLQISQQLIKWRSYKSMLMLPWIFDYQK